MTEIILSWVALGSLLLGLALLLLSPVVERAYGASLVSVVIISAFILAGLCTFNQRGARYP